MRYYVSALLLFYCLSTHAQKYTISGYIKDQGSGESLIGATIINLKTQQGTTANNYGFFSITQASDSVHLRVSYIGYENQVIKLFLDRDIRFTIELVAGTQLKEVEIVGT